MRPLIIFGFAVVLTGCEIKRNDGLGENTVPDLRGKQGKPSQPALTWLERLDRSKPVILGGPWNKAESAWAELLKADYDASELDIWMELQMQILTDTKADVLKSGLRKLAMQEMYNLPEASKKYVGWVKQGLTNGLYVDPDVQKKARALIYRIETGRLPQRGQGFD